MKQDLIILDWLTDLYGPSHKQLPRSPNWPAETMLRSRPPQERPCSRFALPNRPTVFDYHDLRRRVESGELVLRIHHPRSYSPLVWTGSTETSGFSAPQPVFHSMSPSAYGLATQGMPCSPWTESSGMQKKMVSHVLDIRPLISALTTVTHEGRRLNEHLSPFISVTSDIDWAIYWIAYQLATTSIKKLHLAVIRRPGATGTAAHPRALPGGLDIKELIIKPFQSLPPVTTQRPRDNLSSREQADLSEARRKVGQRAEWLLYGRIFGSSIEGDLVFTVDVSETGWLDAHSKMKPSMTRYSIFLSLFRPCTGDLSGSKRMGLRGGSVGSDGARERRLGRLRGRRYVKTCTRCPRSGSEPQSIGEPLCLMSLPVKRALPTYPDTM